MVALQKLERSYFERDTVQVARNLLGSYLARESPAGRAVGLIVETESYMGVEDKASHAYGGRHTPRNSVMYGPAGHAYVYLIYGMYYCLNVVTEEEGKPRAVLIRALEPVEGLEIMVKRRGFSKLDRRKTKELANGPGKLCMAMDIDDSLTGSDLTRGPLYVAQGRKREFEVVTGTRINVDYADEDALKPWRFAIRGNPFVSRPWPH